MLTLFQKEILLWTVTGVSSFSKIDANLKKKEILISKNLEFWVGWIPVMNYLILYLISDWNRIMFIWEYIAQQSIEKICCITENKFTRIYTNEHICEWGRDRAFTRSQTSLTNDNGTLICSTPVGFSSSFYMLIHWEKYFHTYTIS